MAQDRFDERSVVAEEQRNMYGQRREESFPPADGPSLGEQFTAWVKSRLGWEEGSYGGESEFKQKTKAFREISEKKMIKKPLLIGSIITTDKGENRPTTVGSKFDQVVDVLGGDSKQLGFLDLCSLGIIRFFKNMLQAPDRDGYIDGEEESGVHEFFRHLLSTPFYLQQTLAVILAITLTVTGVLPFVHFVFYPDVSDLSKQERKDAKNNAKLRREIFFNPGTWMLVFLVLVGISLIIKAANPLVLGDAAAALAIMQTVFAGIAALMLVAAVISLTVHAISSLVEWAKARKPEVRVTHHHEITQEKVQLPPAENSMPSRQSDVTKPGYEKSENGYVQYYDEKIKGWKNVNPKWGNFLYFVTALGVLTALTLTIGYCLDPAGVFSFMEPIFSFVGGMFAQGVQSAGALSGLDALASLSEPVLQLIGNIFAGVVLVSAAIFIPNLLRQFSPEDIDIPNLLPDSESRNTGEGNEGCSTAMKTESSLADKHQFSTLLLDNASDEQEDQKETLCQRLGFSPKPNYSADE